VCKIFHRKKLQFLNICFLTCKIFHPQNLNVLHTTRIFSSIKFSNFPFLHHTVKPRYSAKKFA
jgi:hypothetical protein